MDKTNNSLNMSYSGSGQGHSTNSVTPSYIGVYWTPENKKWAAKIDRVGLPSLNLGTFKSAEEAAKAHDIVSIKLKGLDASINFSLSCYDVGDIMDSELTENVDGTVALRRVPQQQQQQQQQSLMNLNNASNQNRLDNNNSSSSSSINSQFLQKLANYPLLARGTQNTRDLQRCLHLTDFRNEFGKKLLGGNLELDLPRNPNVQPPTQGGVANPSAGATNEAGPLGLQIQPVVPSNQDLGPALNQIQEPGNNNNGSQAQSQAPGSSNDWDMSQYRRILEDPNFSFDLDMFAPMGGDKKGP